MDVPDIDPFDNDEYRRASETARRNANDAAKKAIEQGEAPTNIYKNLLKTNLELKIKTIDKNTEMTGEQKEALKECETEMNNRILEGLDKKGGNLYDNLGPNAFKKFEKDFGGKKPKAAKELQRVKNAAQKQMLESFKKLVPDLLERFDKTFKEMKFTVDDLGDTEKMDDIARRLDDFAEQTAGETTEAAEQFKKNLIENLKEKMDNGELSNTSGESSWSFKDLMKGLATLMLIGGSIGLFFWFTVLYAEEHSGCQLIDAESGYIPVSTKVVCFNSGKKLNIFNPNGGNVEYSSTQCSCNSSSLKVTCNKKECSSNDEIRPWICNTGNPHCEGNLGDDQYKLYYWGMMTPLDALGNMGTNFANGASKTMGHIWDEIKKAAIVIGIVLGVLLVLWIIYKVVANRKPAETLKIETPSTVTKFGNRGYLGNLSKYNNYAYMGRCGYSNNIPYRYLTAKNLINM